MENVGVPNPSVRRAMFKNIGLLAGCEALGISTSALVITVTALIGHHLADTKSLATLPLALQFLTIMGSTVPASYLMKYHGRRVGFLLGAFLGIVSGLVGAYAIYIEAFALFCLASVLFGASTVFVQYYRFAAVELAGEAYKSRAISLSLSGGIVAAFLGPELAKVTRELFPAHEFVGTYLALSGLFAALMLVISVIRFPTPTEDERRERGQPLADIIRRPTFLVAVFCAAIGYGAMNFLMSATPLAMTAHGHSFDSAAIVIQWHIVGMYAPSLVTGHLIHKFGVVRVLVAGVLMMFVCVAINLSGTSGIKFWFGLVALGIAWNFMFIGGTMLLTESYSPAEKAKVQALNDFLIFGTISFTAMMSGTMFHFFGWMFLNVSILVPVGLCLCAVLWLRQARAKAAHAQPTL